ncbi:MAG: right-handed parallel beta-helix repeat-containing protein [Calditrichia bacterium]|nr:right-handed parallel beta-helix repeat-containing protein [Calditrichia bacterium]
MKNSIFTLCLFFYLILPLLLIETQSVYAQTDIPAGDVSGTWTQSNSPYNINGEITIPDGKTLTIEPGVLVRFNGHYKFYVKGTLLAIGTEQDTILFSASNIQEGWHGIKLLDIASLNDSTIFEYCKFQYGKANTGSGRLNRCGGAISSNLNKLRISHCLFQNNMTYSTSRSESAGGAIAIGGGDPIIEYCEFKENESVYGAAMVIDGYSTDPLIRNNYMHNNNGHGTINIGCGSSPMVINNLIEHNHTDGHGNVHFAGSGGFAEIINNTIVNNTCDGQGGAVFVNHGLKPLFINNIIYGNKPAQVNLLSPSSLSFSYCLIEGGKSGFTGATFSGTYENCIDSDPQFVSPNDFHLQNTSPCIGAGVSSYAGNNTPDNDFENGTRPNPGGSSPDIGAFESKFGSPLTRIVEDEITSSSLEGNPMGDPATRKMMIYLPPSYDQGGNFPVVYLLHGTPVGETAYLIEENWLDWVGVLFSEGPDFPENGFEGMLDDLIAEGKMEEMIIVMPDASCKYIASFYTNSLLNGNYEDYIAYDLVSYIDSHYRTIPNRDNRAIVGHCQGGYGAMKLAMKHPDVFAAVASHSAPLMLEVFKAAVPMVIAENPDGMIGPHPERPFTSMFYAMCAAWSPNLSNPPFFVDLLFEYPSETIIDSVWNKWLEHDPFTMLTTYGANLASLRGVYFDCGDQDEFQFNLLIDPFHQALAAAGIGHEYEIFAGGTHCNKLYSRLALSLSFISDALVTGVEQKDKAEVPLAFSLSQNYPNPFNPTTSISFVLPKMAYVTLEIYNLLGQSVRTLGEDVKEAGSHSVLWDGRDATGRDVASGLYLYCLEVEGQYVQIRKMVLLR